MSSGEAFYLDPTFWVAGSVVSFFVVISAKGGFKKLGSLLDEKSATIARQLTEARALRDEAEHKLAEFQRKQREGEKEASDILAQAKEDAKLMLKAAEEEMATHSARRTRLMEEKIAQLEKTAVKEIRDRAAEAAYEAAVSLVKEQAKSKNKQLDQAIKGLESRLH